MYKKYIPLIFWCGVIFAFSSIPSARISDKDLLDTILRKTAHIVVFATLAFISFYTFNKSYKKAFLFSVIYAISDEFHQRFTPGRGPSFIDVLIDTLGIILALTIIWKNYLAKVQLKIKKLLKKF